MSSTELCCFRADLVSLLKCWISCSAGVTLSTGSTSKKYVHKRNKKDLVKMNESEYFVMIQQLVELAY